MNRSITDRGPTGIAHRPGRATGVRRGRGFTLIEMLMAMVLTLLIMAAVATLFSNVSDSMRDSRSGIAMADRLRGAQNLLQSDLAGVTVTMRPPRNPEDGEGYFEYIEGVIGPIIRPGTSELQAAGLVAPTQEDLDGDGVDDPDTTVGDNDDILMFTTRNLRQPFTGRFGGTTITSPVTSPVAEVIWFVRGTTLYRRVLLVVPSRSGQLPAVADARGFYREYDVSVRLEGNHNWQSKNLGSNAPDPYLVANSLGDLTKRENRYGHQPFAYPHDARVWGRLGMPTLRESAHDAWPFPALLSGSYASNPSPIYSSLQMLGPLGFMTDIYGSNQTRVIRLANGDQFDAWNNPFPWDEVDPSTGTLAAFYDPNTPNRGAEDVVLTNVLSFDVKVWDPGAPVFEDGQGNAIVPGDPGYLDVLGTSPPTTPVSYGAYVDLNYMARLGDNGMGQPNYSSPPGISEPQFHGAGDPRSRLVGSIFSSLLPQITQPSDFPEAARLPAVYDTWSAHYERDGFDQNQDGAIDEATNGIDDNDTGGVDDATEFEAPPPYPYPLRGVQVTIRVFEPDSRQIREVVIEQDFLPE